MKRQPPVEYNEQDLRRENSMLRGLLETLGQDATHNHQVLARFQERELSLLSAGDLVTLLQRLTDGMRTSFALDGVRLLLLDPCHVIHDLLVDSPDADARLIRNLELCTDVHATRARFQDLRSPWLGPWIDESHRPLFGRRLGGSVALLPLR
ncbi:MAG: DUF484 family protein, partial [Chromatiaceae bacterium]